MVLIKVDIPWTFHINTVGRIERHNTHYNTATIYEETLWYRNACMPQPSVYWCYIVFAKINLEMFGGCSQGPLLQMVLYVIFYLRVWLRQKVHTTLVTRIKGYMNAYTKCITGCVLIGTCKGAARGGLKGLKPPPLVIRILMFIFLVIHQHCKSRSGVLQNVLRQYHKA